MSIAPNLTLISEVLPVNRRDFTLTDPTILNPNASNPLLDGEWLEMNASAYTVGRGSGEATKNSWPVFSLRGQYDTQAISKTTLLFFGGYEADTTIVNTAGIGVGDFLVVTDVTISSLTRRGLAKASGSGQHLIQGMVTRLTASGKIRFLHTSPFQITI